MKSKKVSDSATVISQLMVPNDANFYGFVHGGVILQLIDRVAYVCAARHSESHCITASLDRVNFLNPIKVGELVHLMASINFVGHTSMEVGIRIESEDLISKKKRHVASSYVSIVAVYEKLKPKKVFPLNPVSAEEKRRSTEGKKRKEEKENLMKKELKEE